MILVVGLSSPTASLVRFSCDDSGATTMTVCTFESECASDPCCPDDQGDEAMSADCCRTDVFSLASTSPVPVSFALPTALVPVSVFVPSSILQVTRVDACAPSSILTRNTPLLV
jgi:hypothetical protein